MKGRIAIPFHNRNRDLVAYAGRYLSDGLPNNTPRYK